MKRFIIIIAGLLLFFLALLGLLAKDSKPGQYLYWYRITVREPIIDAFYVTPEARGNYELELLSVRLKELRSLVNNNAELDSLDQAILAVNYRREKLSARILNWGKSGKVEIADNIFSGFKAELSAYKFLLDTAPPSVVAIFNDSQTQIQVIDQQLLSEFNERYSLQDSIKLFDDRANTVEKFSLNIQNLLITKLETIAPELKTPLQQKLDLANTILRSALNKHGHDLDREAYRELNDSFAILKELKIYLSN